MADINNTNNTGNINSPVNPNIPTPTPIQNPNESNVQQNSVPSANAQNYDHGTLPPAPLPPLEKSKKSKAKVGKILFVSLICLSIVLSSVALGIAFTQPAVKVADTTNVSEEDVDKTKTPISVDGAEANLEDSPLSFNEYSGEGSMTPEQVYAAVKDSNVGILVYYGSQMIGEGSGIIVGEDDSGKYTYIITAAHVICDSGIDVQVQFSDESECEADIIGFDSKTDIGVVRVEKTGLQAATFGNSDNLVVGQTVYAIGNPGGTEFFGSFTSGIVSAIDRPVPSTSTRYDLPCIQHNAAINPGNSGGALVNEFGQVIGLNSSKISSTEYEGMGFAVPSTTMIEVYNEILANGYVSNRPMLGINYVAVSSDRTYSEVAWQNDLPYGSVVIASISESSDLNNHDIEIGDIIIAVNGTELSSTDTLLELIENSSVGDEIELTICRLTNRGEIDETFDVTVKLVEDIGDNTVVESEASPNSLEDYIYGY